MKELEKLQVTQYEVIDKLPDPFRFNDGSRVKTPADWRRRREELIETAAYLQYGHMPPEPDFLEVEPLYLGGPDRMNVYRIYTGRREHPVIFQMAIHMPKQSGKRPVVIDGDWCWDVMNDRYLAKMFTDRGIMLVKFNRCEIVPDIQGIPRNSVIHRAYPEYDFGAIAAWAWGYSRCVDAVEKLGIADMNNITFTGLSRGGKTALLAGALDERAAIVNTEAPCAGGSCYRIRMRAITENGTVGRSEELDDIVQRFPSWFSERMQQYIGRVTELPFDEHELKALVAPRVLFNSEAKSDIWAGPLCAYQSNIAAREVYRFLGAEENLLWYWRDGYHDQTMEDFEMLLNLICNRIEGEPLSDKFMNVPFDAPEAAFDWRAPQ
jgi:hypothetical protein